MKVQANRKRTVQTSGELINREMSLDAEGINMAIGILRDKMYSNKVLAVIREYWANARDEHVKYNVEQAVQITLPTTNDPVFRVRDFARGLSREDVFNVYGQYFKSTKDQENVSIGGFGLGSKSGHAYGDAFTVTSHFEGTMSVYECILETDDETGFTVGRMYLLDEAPTDETGIEVSLNVRPADIRNFESQARDLFMYLTKEQRPIVKGRVFSFTNIERRSSFPSGDGWYARQTMYGDYGRLVAVMGGVGFSVDPTFFDDDSSFTKEMLALVKSTGLVVTFPIGSLSVAPNRETLEYTPRTKSLIRQRMRQVQREIESWIEEQISNAPDLLRAKAALGDLTRGLDKVWHKDRKFLYKGSEISPGTDFKATVTVYDTQSGEVEGERGDEVRVSFDDRLYYLIAPSNTGGIYRARTLFESDTSRVVVFQFEAMSEFQLFLSKNDLTVEMFDSWLDVEKTMPKRVNSRGDGTGSPRSIISKMYLHKWNPHRYGYRDKFARWHQPAPDKAVYVVLDHKKQRLALDRKENKYGNVDFGKAHAKGVFELVRLIDPNIPLLAVKYTAKKIPAAWETVEQFVKRSIKNDEVRDRVSTECGNNTEYEALPSMGELDAMFKSNSMVGVPAELKAWYQETKAHIDRTKPKGSAYGYSSNQKTVTALVAELRLLDAAGLKKAERRAEQYKELLDRYPVLFTLTRTRPNQWGDGISAKQYQLLVKQVAEYISLKWEPFTKSSRNKQKEAA